MQLLEYDKRFEKYGSEFTFYDYNEPEELPSSLKHACQIVVADPPYLVRKIVTISDPLRSRKLSWLRLPFIFECMQNRLMDAVEPANNACMD